jgi:hypothetical protein
MTTKPSSYHVFAANSLTCIKVVVAEEKILTVQLSFKVTYVVAMLRQAFYIEEFPYFRSQGSSALSNRK